MAAVRTGALISAEPGQGPGQLGRIGLPVVLFAGGSVGGEFGLDGAQQPDLGGDLGGQFLIRDGRVAVVELDAGQWRRAATGRRAGVLAGGPRWW
jgi:hypothetical protein